jgi:hypothetical protein
LFLNVESFVFTNANTDKAFTQAGYSYWKKAVDSTKGFAMHASSKEP